MSDINLEESKAPRTRHLGVLQLFTRNEDGSYEKVDTNGEQFPKTTLAEKYIRNNFSAGDDPVTIMRVVGTYSFETRPQTVLVRQ